MFNAETFLRLNGFLVPLLKPYSFQEHCLKMLYIKDTGRSTYAQNNKPVQIWAQLPDENAWFRDLKF